MIEIVSSHTNLAKISIEMELKPIEDTVYTELTAEWEMFFRDQKPITKALFENNTYSTKVDHKKSNQSIVQAFITYVSSSWRF